MPIKKYYQIAKTTLFPICRSITGEGIRKTLQIIKKEFPKLKIYYSSSGKKVFDWKIPAEWNVTNAYVLDKNNKKIVDFKKNNLHVISYSTPVNKILKKDELLNRLYTNKKVPDGIPYVTSYYKKYWGFCCSYNQKKNIEKIYNKRDRFTVTIDSSFKKNGKLTYGELIIPGKSKQEILISTYICHPSMANNELSGPIVSMALIKYFIKKKLQKTLRFIFIPETIGSIVFLDKNLKYLQKNLIGGYNLSCIGDNRMHSCMFSKYGNTLTDHSLTEAYKKLNIRPKIYSFLKRGSDERQYNSPGIDLPIASIFRTKYGEYPEYHTSLDNFDVVTQKGLLGGYSVAKTSIEILLKKIIPKNLVLCEPNMGKRGLYPTLSKLSKNEKKPLVREKMNFLIYSDGKNDLKKISSLIKLNYSKTYKIYKLLLKKKLIIS
jgi:aminopeptidase-like protein